MKKRKLSELLAFKANLLEILVIAVLVALGVNVMASGIIGYLSLSFYLSIIVGFLLVSLGLLILLRNVKPINSGTFKYKGVICVEKDSHNLLPIEGYELTEDISKYVRALCAENKAFQKIWNEEPIGSGLAFDEAKSTHKIPKSNALLIEAIEYYVIHSLSLHLSSHFINNDLISDDYLVTLERKEIPSVLLENRYLDLFSRPMEEREQFLDHGKPPTHGKVVYAFGKDGAIFDHFEMVLPKGSSVVREKDSSISIKTNRFILNVRPVFGGWNSNLPRHFEDLYLGRNFNSVSTFEVGLFLTVEFSPKSLLTAKGWEYYWWIDSFLDRLERSFSKAHFLEKISWHQNAAMMKMADNRRNKQLRETDINEK
jgi:hypothetical protein